MKTEGLTLDEARIALAEGYEIQSGHTKWRWKAGEAIEYSAWGNEWDSPASGPNCKHATYSIIQPEPKRLGKMLSRRPSQNSGLQVYDEMYDKLNEVIERLNKITEEPSA